MSATQEVKTPRRLSPLDDVLRHAGGTWGELADMPVVLSYGDVAHERSQAARLALADMSALERVTIKGSEAAELLEANQLPIPEKVLDVARCDRGGFIARTGSAEFVCAGGLEGGMAARLFASAAGRERVYALLRQEAVIAVTGQRAAEALQHTSSYDFSGCRPGSPAVMTRVAGVSCLAIAGQAGGAEMLELSTDGTYGVYLWEKLLDIVRELGGAAIGLAALFPQLDHPGAGTQMKAV